MRSSFAARASDHGAGTALLLLLQTPASGLATAAGAAAAEAAARAAAPWLLALTTGAACERGKTRGCCSA